MSGIQTHYSSFIQSRYRVAESKDVVKPPGAIIVSGFIHEDTTPEEFDLICNDPEPQYHNALAIAPALATAVRRGNLRLAKHIVSTQVVKQGKVHLSNFRDHPLNLAMQELDRERVFKLAKLLISLGANVNAISSSTDRTALKLSAIYGNKPLINMLIVNGGMTYDPLKTGEFQHIQDALSLLYQRVKPLFMAEEDKKSILNSIPKELICKIAQHHLWCLAHSWKNQQHNPPPPHCFLYTKLKRKMRYQDLIKIFNDCFFEKYNTRLVKGNDEPLYLPADEKRPHHELYFAHGFFASALHESSHWLIAGEKRRKLVDFGYWYAPDGRSLEQQELFQSVEVKPQAIEWILSRAAGYRFRVSIDNLDGPESDTTDFKNAVYNQVKIYCREGLSARAESFRQALCHFYGTPSSLNIEDFDRDAL